MAIFPETKGADILARRGIAEVIGDARAKMAERSSTLCHEENLDDLRGLQERLANEIDFEEEFSARFSQALEELDRAQFPDDFAPLLPTFNSLAQEYFLRRSSVLTLHALCNTYRGRLLRHVLQRVEEALELEGEGRPPSPYCCLASGSIGRSEQTFCVEPSYFLIYGDDSPGSSVYFAVFVYRAIAMMESAGLLKSAGDIAPLKAVWHGSRKDWREENIAGLAADERGRLVELVQRADLRLLHGNAALAEEMVNVVRSMLEFHHGALREKAITSVPTPQVRAAVANPLPVLREIGKRIAEIPTGLDFFGRLRLERSGMHRRKFDLEQFALSPLISNVRMLAIRRGLHQTGTISRIQALQAGGQLTVELTERLLRAYHDFMSLKVRRQISKGCEEGARFVDPRDLTETEEQQLRHGLEAAAGLETIAYLCFTEEG